MSNRLTKLIYLLISVFTAGAALAAVLTILFAPRSGRQTRKRIADLIRGLVFWQNKRISRLFGRDLREIKSQRKPLGWIQKWIA